MQNEAAGPATRPADAFFPDVYEQLRRMAHHYLRGERDDVALQTTGLVHEAYLRVAALQQVAWTGKTHVLAVAATQMRRILVEQARAALTEKRGRRPVRISLDGVMFGVPSRQFEIVALDEALERLGAAHPRPARVAELRLFAGMLIEEIAAHLQVCEKTVRLDWQKARAWLARELAHTPGIHA